MCAVALSCLAKSVGSTRHKFSTYGMNLKYNQKYVGFPHNIHSTMSPPGGIPVGMHYHYISQGWEMDKIVDVFIPGIVYPLHKKYFHNF